MASDTEYGRSPDGSGCQPTASAAEEASSQSGIPNAEDLSRCHDDNSFIEAVMAVPEGWWWTVGVCSVSCHASCGPDRAYHDRETLDLWDFGFHADYPQPSTTTEALHDVAAQAAIAMETQRAETENTGSVAKP